MTSSIYKLDVSFKVVGSIESIAVTDGGTGYTEHPDVTITDSGTGATATSVLTPTSVASYVVTDGGDGYTSAPQVTVSAPDTTGTTATATATISGSGSVNAVTVVVAGDGYTQTPTVTIALPKFRGGQAFADAVLTGTSVASIIVDEGGTGYSGVVTVTIDPPTAGDTATADATITAVPLDTDILTTPVEITSDMVKPGGGGILRIYFTLDFDISPGTIAVTNNGDLKGFLNADNTAQVIDDGLYRFDIDVEAGDSINLQLKDAGDATEIDVIQFVRMHLVQFGA